MKMQQILIGAWLLGASAGLAACGQPPAPTVAPAAEPQLTAPPVEGLGGTAEPAVVPTVNPAASGPTSVPLSVEEAFTEAGPELVPAATIAKAIDQGMDIVFLDARTPLDYEASHIPGAIDVPYFEAAKHIDGLPKDKWLVAYCECPTAEAHQVADTLKNAGFTKVKVIEEGLQGWKQLGKEVVASTPSASVPMTGSNSSAAPVAPVAPVPGATPTY